MGYPPTQTHFSVQTLMWPTALLYVHSG